MEAVGPGINQAHNGYLEQYLNLGYIGVAFIAVIILSGLLKVRRHLSVDPAAGMLRLCFIVTAVLFNSTEASFYGVNNMWLLLLVGCLELPPQRQPRAVGLTQQRMVQGKVGIGRTSYSSNRKPNLRSTIHQDTVGMAPNPRRAAVGLDKQRRGMPV